MRTRRDRARLGIRGAGLVAGATLLAGCGGSGTSTLDTSGGGGSGGSGASSGTGGSSGSSGSGGSGGSGATSGSGGTAGLDCSNVGCAEAPLCAEDCPAPCGCCGCVPGETRDVGGETYVCTGDCFAPPDPCACSTAPPADGESCDSACDGRACAWEVCDGDGLTTARCDQGSFTVSVDACGGQLCGPQDSMATNTCDAGFVCIHQTGGADFPEECRLHECGDGPITCACLGTSCPGECVQTAALSFMCNTCPGGGCP